uniref:Importin-4-like isoform X1 n=1 Tax=Crassostrea virginica TaxID=6565 RepID=A0A8B8CCR9_CRAVI|nr:importin-4-like isoform X1 [Crassostrea virginica]
MASVLEETLGRLLLPDNNTIKQATLELKEIFKDPNIVPGLCQILSSSQSAQVRQLAAVLLRRKVQKGRQWRALPENVCQNIRENILQLLLQEPEKFVRNSIAQVVATVAKHDLPKNQWPQLFLFIQQYTRSQSSAEREVGTFVLYSVASMAAEQLKPHLVSMLQLLTEVIHDSENRLVPYYVIRTITEVIFFIGDDEVVRALTLKYIQNVIPRMLQVIQELIPVDEDQACELLEVFDEMLECEVSIIVPHIKSTLEFCLQVGSRTDLGDGIRVKALSFVASLIRLKKKAFLKHQMVEPVLSVLFPIMCAGSEEDEDEDDLDDHECRMPSMYAPQVIDAMAIHLPPDKVIPNIIKLVEPNINSDSPSHRRASFVTLAVAVEGCADYIKNRHLHALLDCVVKGLNDPDPGVRNSALFALGQFCEHLQPEITSFASGLLPLLFQYLGKASQEAEKNPKGLTKSYYALETFCENLDKDILPYLPTLMEHMLTTLKTVNSTRAKELAISAIGATANSAKELLKPYFGDIIEQFKPYLAPHSEMGGLSEEDTRKLQIQTLDTLSVIARSIGEETFAPIAKECADFGIGLLNSVDDPDLRRCVYGLFAALSVIMKNEISPYLEVLVTFMMASLKSTEGVQTHYKEDEEQVAIFNEEDLYDEEDISAEDDDDEDEDQKIQGISVKNEFLDEKEDACTSLGELAGNTGAAFLPYFEQSMKDVLEMIDYPAPGVKKAAMAAMGQMCICVHKANQETPSAENKFPELFSTVVQKFLDVMKEDVDSLVVMSAIDTLYEMLDKIGQPVIQVQGIADAILTRMKQVFTHKLACQDQDAEDDDEEAEFDGMLIESAGDVLPAMAKLLGGPNFMPFFTSFLTDLEKRLKETSSIAERSFSIGTIAEIIQASGSAVVPFLQKLYPLFLKFVKDADDEVCSNAVFGLGCLCASCGDHLTRQYSEILKTLHEVMTKTSNERVHDNVCAATCRMIMTSKNSLPLGQVLPSVLQCLPLKEDFEENKTVFECLFQLYLSGDQEIMQYIPKLLMVVAHIVGTDQVKQDTQALLINFVKDLHIKFPAEFQTVQGSLTPEQAVRLQACLEYTNGSS